MNGKKVLLFGTCGFGGNQEYFAQIEKRVMEYLPPDCEYLGCYLCQGKMMMSVRTRYEQMLQNRQKKVMAEKMIENFDRALLHPDAEDLVRATEFVRRVCK